MDLNTVASFTWGWGSTFFLKTEGGNFIWLDPDYGGDNTIKRFDGNYSDFCDLLHIDFGRDKGRHRIIDYCGPDVKWL